MKKNYKEQGAGKKILFVEDGEDNLRTGKEYFESLGYEVVTARDYQSGRDLLRSESGLNMVVTDVFMPHDERNPKANEQEALNSMYNALRWAVGSGKYHTLEELASKSEYAKKVIQRPRGYRDDDEILDGLIKVLVYRGELDVKDHQNKVSVLKENVQVTREEILDIKVGVDGYFGTEDLCTKEMIQSYDEDGIAPFGIQLAEESVQRKIPVLVATSFHHHAASGEPTTRFVRSIGEHHEDNLKIAIALAEGGERRRGTYTENGKHTTGYWEKAMVTANRSLYGLNVLLEENKSFESEYEKRCYLYEKDKETMSSEERTEEEKWIEKLRLSEEERKALWAD